MKDAEVIERLKEICTDADPTKLYRSLVKIGQGCASGLISTTDVLIKDWSRTVPPAVSTQHTKSAPIYLSLSSK